MSINYATGVKLSRLEAVRTALNAGAAGGKLRIYTASYATLLVEFTLLEADQNAADNVLDLVGSPINATAAATGTAAIARLTDSDNTLVADGLTVGTSGTDVIVDSTSITSGQTVTLNDAAITHAA